MKHSHCKIIGCDFCQYRKGCQEKSYNAPSGCNYFKEDKTMEEYELNVFLKVKVKADSKENAIKQVFFDRYENNNPCVVITENKYIGEILVKE